METAMNRPLNSRQLRFIGEYGKDLNAQQAYVRAGYSEKSAYNGGPALLRRFETMPQLAAAKQAFAESAGVTQKTVLTGLLVEALGIGKDTNSNARVNAWEKLGRHVGLFDKSGDETEPASPVTIQFLSPEGTYIDCDGKSVQVGRRRDPADGCGMDGGAA